MAQNNFAEFGKKLLDAWKSTKTSQKVLIIAVIALTVVILVVFANMAGQVEYETLFTGLTDQEAGTVLTALQERGVDVRTGPDGTLMVPADQVRDLRYQLTSEGIPSTDQLDYSIYSDNASSFGATDQDKTFYEQAQLQLNLAQTINRMDKVQTSTVLLAIAEESPYVLSGEEPKVSTASILVTLRDPQEPLSQSEVGTIRALVAKAVPSLSEDNIAIGDQTGRSYPTQDAESSGTSSVEEQLALQKQVSEDLEAQIIALLTPVFGPENISASVNVLLDFDTRTTNTLTLSPPTNDAENMGIITSMRQTAERLQGVDSVAEGEPGMDPNGGSPTYQEIDANAGDSTYYNVVTEVNAEVNQISEQIEEAKGDITDISCTVILNGGDALDDILDDVADQVSTAIGVPLDRVTVSAMPFEQNAQFEEAMAEQQAAAEQAQRMETLRTFLIPIIIAAGIVIATLLILAHLRKKRREEQAAAELAAWEAQQAAEAEAARIAAETGQLIDVETGEEMVDVGDVLKDKNDTLANVRQLVEEDSAAIAQLLRNWLSDNYGGA